MKTISYVKIYKNKKYKGKFIALLENSNQVVGVGSTPQEALKKAEKQGCEDPVLTKVPTKATAYIL
ncbi:MAG: hypothetical protein KAX20_03350 [Candidatus Omnitrophica bacterium]|nr:hypothetical protein [Candidatus Omnitrophota bacterium]